MAALQSERPWQKIANQSLSVSELSQAQQLLSDWQQWSVSRYNSYQPTFDFAEPFGLVICTTITSLQSLLKEAVADALAQQLKHLFIVSEHDGGMLHLTRQLAEALQDSATALKLHYLSTPSHHAVLLKQASTVITDTSWLGFEALLWGKRVVVTRAPFYAGLGLTVDLVEQQHRCNMTLPELVAYTLITQTASFDIASSTQITIGEALSWLDSQNRQRWKFPALVYGVGFNWHWRKVVQAFFAGSTLKFVKKCEDVPPGQAAVIWGMKQREFDHSHLKKLYRLEDGFIRSVGLGALFAKPLSWIADSQGLYFDATKQCDLEELLAHRDFSAAELNDAAVLREWLCANKVSKYNTGHKMWQRPATEKVVVLVVGQVETDASIAFGASQIRRNIDLLMAVRERNPTAYIIYKPHPDVVAGARALGHNEQLVQQYCDQIESQVDISVMLEQVDEVHVLTSLAGFEALLRYKKVVCYGMPFYAGWGLTQDMTSCSRRSRNLTLDELVSGSLNIYPMYIDSHTGFYSSALEVAKTLVIQREQPHKLLAIVRRCLRFAINFVRGKH